MQIFILNSDEKVVGTLTSNTGSNLASPFFEDEYSMDLYTGAETFTFKTFSNIPQANNIVVGNYVAFQYKDETKLFQITSVTDEHNTEFVKTVYCEMAGIELINTPLRPREYPSVNLKQFVTSVLSDTDWKVGSIDSRITEVYTLELTDYTTVYGALQEHVINTFGGEISFRVVMKNGRIAGKYVDVFAEKGSFEGFRFSYHKNVDNVVRTVDSSELATALIGVGSNNIDFKEINASDKPKNQDWVGDEESYKQWNKNGSHIFGISKHDTDDPATLLDLTRKDLEARKNPKITYELSVGYFDYEELDIGDTVYCVDNEFSPPLHLSARVNQLVVSFTDRDKNACVLANFKEVQSKINDEIRQLASLIDSKFPIGSDQIQDGAVNGDKISQGAVSGSHVAHDTLIADHIKANQIKTEHLESDSITADKIKANEIKTDHLQANSVTTEKLQANVVTSDKIQAGSIVGDHLTSNLIDATHIKADQIEAGHIKSESINTNHLSANSVSTDKLQANSISTDKLQANSIQGTHIKGQTITGDKIVGNTIEGTHIKGETLEGTHIKGETITGSHIQGDTIVGNHIQSETIEGKHLKADIIQGDHIQGGTIEGDHIIGGTIEGTHIKGDTITGTHIQSNTIKTEHIQSGSINGSHIQGNVIVGNHIQGNTIGTNHLQANSVNTDKLQANSIDTKHLKSEIIEAGHIKSDTITADQIASNTITGNEIKGNTITGNHIQGNTITSNHIQAGAIGSNQIQTGALTSDKMVIANGFIKNAMIDSIVASKITSGEIDTSKVTIQSPNGNIVIADSTQQFRDKNGNVRVQIGEDNNGDFTFVLLDEQGQGVLIDHTGLKEKAIADGLIKNKMIGDGQIDGRKVDINSIIRKINTDGTESFLASKVQLDTTGQTLDVSFSQINSKVDEKVSHSDVEHVVGDIVEGIVDESVNEGLSKIEIGGRNLAEKTYSTWTDSNVSQWSGGINYSVNGTERHGKQTSFEELGLSVGDNYTISVDLKAVSKNIKLRIDLYRTTTMGSNYIGKYSETVLTGTNKKVSYTGVVTEEFPYFVLYIANHDTSDTTTTTEQYRHLKIEKGNKATDWTPAPKDTEKLIADVNNALTETTNKVNTVDNTLNDIASDSKLTPSEKYTIKKDLDVIISEKPTIVNQASVYNIATTEYTSSYDVLYNYVNPKVSNLTTTTEVDGSQMRTYFKNYYSQKALLLKKISDSAKNLIGDVDSKVDNIKIGGRNFLLGSDVFLESTTGGNKGYYSLTEEPSYFLQKPIVVSFEYENEELTYTSGSGRFGVEFSFEREDGSRNYIGSWVWISKTEPYPAKKDRIFAYFPNTSSVPITKIHAMGMHVQGVSGKIKLGRPKVEIGNKMTDWTPAPEDTEEKVQTLTTNFGVQQGKIEGLISDTTITKDGTTTKLKDAHSKLEATVSGINSTVTETTTKLNNLTIGGRNLIKNSKIPHSTSCASENLTATIDNTNGYMKVVVANSTNGNWNSFTFNGGYTVLEDNLQEGDEFTFSCLIRSNESTTPPTVYFKSGLGYYAVKGTVSSKWSTIYYTGKWKDAENIAFHFGWSGKTAGTYYIKDFKIEKGNKATEWTPALEDTEAYIEHTRGTNQWLVSKYSGEKVTSDIADFSFKSISGLTPNNILTYDDNNSLAPFSDTNYVAHYMTNVYFDAETTKTFAYRSDDGSIIFINGQEVHRQVYNASNQNISLTFKKGWNVLEVLQSQGTGGQVVYFSPKVSDVAKDMACNIVNVSSSTSQIKQLSDSIELKVDADGVISAIALDESGVKISGEKIDLEGLITLSSLNDDLESMFTQEFNKTVIDGGRIKTGSITADHVNLKGLTVTYTNPNDATDTLETLKISSDGDITLSGSISSYDYSEAENTGWELSRDGDAVLNNATVRGNVILPSAGISNHGSGEKPNLLKNTDFRKTQTVNYTWDKNLNGDKIASDWGFINTGVTSPEQGYHANFDEHTFEFPTIRLANLNSSIGQAKRWMATSQHQTGVFKANTTYTFSILTYSDTVGYQNHGGLHYRKTGSTSAGFHAGMYYFKVQAEEVGRWIKRTFTFTTTSDLDTSQSVGFYIYGHEGAEGTGWIRDMKIEEGSEATGWIPRMDEIGSTVRFWSGASFGKRHEAPFRVTQDGSVYATQGHFEGTFSGRAQIGDITIEDQGKGYIQMNNDSGARMIYLGEDAVHFTPNVTMGTTSNGLLVDNSNVLINSKDFEVSNVSGNTTKSVFKVNRNSNTFLELNGTHSFKTSSDTMEIVGNHTKFSNDVTVSGDLTAENMVVGEMRMERKTETGNIGVDFIFL